MLVLRVLYRFGSFLVYKTSTQAFPLLLLSRFLYENMDGFATIIKTMIEEPLSRMRSGLSSNFTPPSIV